MNGILVCLILSSTAFYFSVIIDMESETIELCELEDNKSEKEEKKSEEYPDDKVQGEVENQIITDAEEELNALRFKYLKNIYHHPEIQTPPPERANSVA